MNRTKLGCLVLAVAMATGCSSTSDQPTAAEGDIFDLSAGEVIGVHSEVTLPSGNYDFIVSKPSTTIDEITAESAGVATEARDGTSFVTVSWRMRSPRGDAWAGAVDPHVSPRLTLLADSEEYDLGEFDHFGYPKVVVVSGKPSRVALSVEYDGRSQVVGSQDLMEDDAPRTTKVACPAMRQSRDLRQRGLSVGGAACWLRFGDKLPYHSAVGWAPKNQAYVVVEMRTTKNSYLATGTPKNPGIVYDVTYAKPTYLLDGERPVKVLPSLGIEPKYSDYTDHPVLLFEVPEFSEDAEFHYQLAYTGEADDGPPLSGTYDVRRTLELS